MERTLAATEYEKIAIGAILSGKVSPDIILKLKLDYFLNLECKELYDIMSSIYAESGDVDYISVLDEYSKIKTLSKAKEIMDEFINIVPFDLNMQRVLKNLEKTYVLHKSLAIVEIAKNKIVLNPQSAQEIMYSAYESISKLTSLDEINYDIISEFSNTVNNIINGTGLPSIIRTGIHGIDSIIGGLSTGEVTIIAGRPGHGKTSFSVALADSILMSNPDSVVLKFELEMPKEQIKRKFLALKSGVSLNKIRTGVLSQHDIQSLNDSLEMLSKYKNRLYIYDDVYDIQSMLKIARSVKANVVMVDFLTLMDDVGDDRRNDLADVVITAKKYAKAKNIAFIMFSQLNRNPETRIDHKPTMSDIAESDQITQLASEVMLLFYQYKYTYDESDKNTLTVIFDKARYSSIGQTQLFFYPEYSYVGDVKKIN